MWLSNVLSVEIVTVELLSVVHKVHSSDVSTVQDHE